MDWKLGAVAAAAALIAADAGAATKFRCIDHTGKPKAHWTVGQCPDPSEIAEEREVSPRTAADPCGRRLRDFQLMLVCKSAIQQQLGGEYAWTSIQMPERFPDAQCVEGTDDVARYAGRAVMDLRFGGRQQRTYECKVDTDTALIIEVKLGYP